MAPEVLHLTRIKWNFRKLYIKISTRTKRVILFLCFCYRNRKCELTKEREEIMKEKYKFQKDNAEIKYNSLKFINLGKYTVLI